MKSCIALTVTIGILLNPMILHAESTDQSDSIEQKLDSIVLPPLHVEDQSIRSVVETLRELARQNSKDKAGINIFLRTTDLDPSATVTFEMPNPTLREAVPELAKPTPAINPP